MTNFVFCPHFSFPSITHCQICPILQSVFLPLSFWTLQQAFAFLCTDVYISPLLKVPYLSPPHLPSLSSALLCSQVCYLWVSLLACECLSSILCSTPSELIRLWRAIYPPLKERESANFSSSPFLPYSRYIWMPVFKVGPFPPFSDRRKRHLGPHWFG